ncbi:SMI1/KNR4 family protein [Rossellomorea marisflavi]|uniref:SMI1/KNR4 family protein n=1 Tax=Rossellomorea marisflavi TaxID=189381 RepID=UPI00064E6820|nr:SMI1/KNR4 family protein [Rossellomorea marisflavi]KML32060.1 SMI1/KNR4 family protein [Rossellomorea marisflavi]GLI82626.1 SMI1/KNR4 family protein [Rossellomorea marisflavi]
MSKIVWQFADQAVSEEYVKKTGSELGYELPEDYIECVALNNGANVEPDLFHVGTVEKVFGTLLSYDQDNDEYIVDVFNSYKAALPNGLVPFAFDPAGNLLCFDYKNHESNPVIVYWEHENAWEKEMVMKDEGLTEEQAEERVRENVFYVAATFTEFLDKLHD